MHMAGFFSLIFALIPPLAHSASEKIEVPLTIDAKIMEVGKPTAGRLLFLTGDEYRYRFSHNQLSPIDIVVVHDFPSELDPFPLAGVITDNVIQPNCHMVRQAQLIQVPFLTIPGIFEEKTLRALAQENTLVALDINLKKKTLNVRTEIKEAEALKIFRSRFDPIKLPELREPYLKIQPLFDVPPEQLPHYGDKLIGMYRGANGKPDPHYPDPIAIPEDIDAWLMKNTRILTSAGEEMILQDAISRQYDRMDQLGIFSKEVPQLLEEIRGWIDQIGYSKYLNQDLILQLNTHFRKEGGIFAPLVFRSSNGIENRLGAGVFHTEIIAGNEVTPFDVRVDQIINAIKTVLKSKFEWKVWVLCKLFGVDPRKLYMGIGPHIYRNDIAIGGVAEFHENGKYLKTRIVIQSKGESGTSPKAGNYFEEIWVMEDPGKEIYFSKIGITNFDGVEDPKLTLIDRTDLIRLHQQFKIRHRYWHAFEPGKDALLFEWGMRGDGFIRILDNKDFDSKIAQVKYDDKAIISRPAAKAPVPEVALQTWSELDETMAKKLRSKGFHPFSEVVTLDSKMPADYLYFECKIGERPMFLFTVHGMHDSYLKDLQKLGIEYSTYGRLTVVAKGNAGKTELTGLVVESSSKGSRPQNQAFLERIARAIIQPQLPIDKNATIGFRGKRLLRLNRLLSPAESWPGLSKELSNSLHEAGFMSVREGTLQYWTNGKNPLGQEYFWITIDGSPQMLIGEQPETARLTMSPDTKDHSYYLKQLEQISTRHGVEIKNNDWGWLRPIRDNVGNISELIIGSSGSIPKAGETLKPTASYLAHLYQSQGFSFSAGATVEHFISAIESSVWNIDQLLMMPAPVQQATQTAIEFKEDAWPGMNPELVDALHREGFYSIREYLESNLTSHYGRGATRLTVEPLFFVIETQGKKYVLTRTGDTSTEDVLNRVRTGQVRELHKKAFEKMDDLFEKLNLSYLKSTWGTLMIELEKNKVSELHTSGGQGARSMSNEDARVISESVSNSGIQFIKDPFLRFNGESYSNAQLNRSSSSSPGENPLFAQVDRETGEFIHQAGFFNIEDIRNRATHYLSQDYFYFLMEVAGEPTMLFGNPDLSLHSQEDFFDRLDRTLQKWGKNAPTIKKLAHGNINFDFRKNGRLKSFKIHHKQAVNARRALLELEIIQNSGLADAKTRLEMALSHDNFSALSRLPGLKNKLESMSIAEIIKVQKWVDQREFTEVEPEVSLRLEEAGALSVRQRVLRTHYQSSLVPFLRIRDSINGSVTVSWEGDLDADKRARILEALGNPRVILEGVLNLSVQVDVQSYLIDQIGFDSIRGLRNCSPEEMRAFFSSLEDSRYQTAISLAPALQLSGLEWWLDKANAANGGYGSVIGRAYLYWREWSRLLNGEPLNLYHTPFADLDESETEILKKEGYHDFTESFPRFDEEILENEDRPYFEPLQIQTEYSLLKVVSGSGANETVHYRLLTGGNTRELGKISKNLEIVQIGKIDASFALPKRLLTLQLKSIEGAVPLSPSHIKEIMYALRHYAIQFDKRSQLLYSEEVASALTPLLSFSNQGEGAENIRHALDQYESLKRFDLVSVEEWAHTALQSLTGEEPRVFEIPFVINGADKSQILALGEEAPQHALLKSPIGTLKFTVHSGPNRYGQRVVVIDRVEVISEADGPSVLGFIQDRLKSSRSIELASPNKPDWKYGLESYRFYSNCDRILKARD